MRNIIGVCVASAGEDLAADFLRSLSEKAYELGYKTFIYVAPSEIYYDNHIPLTQSRLFDIIDFDSLAGLVIMSETLKEEEFIRKLITKAKEKGAFAVSVDRYEENCFNVVYNYKDAFERIVDHVISVHGAKTINIMAGMRNNEFSDERIECCRRVMAMHGLELEEDRILYGDFWSYPTAAAMDEFMESGIPMPDAFVCCNDSMAMTVCDKLRSYGFKVPDDVIVTGFDGIYEERFHFPRLTTAVQDVETAAKTCAQTIDRVMHGLDVGDMELIEHKPMLGQSCGCKSKDDANLSDQVTHLFDIMGESKNVDTFMAALDNGVSNSDSLVDTSGYITKYSIHFGYKYFALCLENTYMNVNDDYGVYLENEGMNSDKKLIMCERLDGRDTPPYYATKLFSFDKAMEEYSIFLFWELNIQLKYIGYGVCALSTGMDGTGDNMDLRNFRKYSTNLNHSLDVANSRAIMKKVIRKLRSLYIRDHTGLLNRHGFYELVGEICKKAEPDDFMLLVSVDMDGLKTINDSYGHAEGDIAINAVVAALRTLENDRTICARFGGDEFTIACVTDEDPGVHALSLTERVKSEINKFNETSGKPYKVGISTGYSCAKASPAPDMDALIRNADNMMYAEKSTHSDSRYASYFV
ncbi:MAG: GGDEF domain-containing protein [Oscillospiraceae bacterium]|nr:GGDEF domain-containing protein [Oscillospiraceae bacterium]